MEKKKLQKITAGFVGGALFACSTLANAWWLKTMGGSLDIYQAGKVVWGHMPIVNISDMPTSSATNVYVQTYNYRASSYVSIKLCSEGWVDGVKWCSPTVSTSGVGHWRYTFSTWESRMNNDVNFSFFALYFSDSAGLVGRVADLKGIALGG